MAVGRLGSGYRSFCGARERAGVIGKGGELRDLLLGVLAGEAPCLAAKRGMGFW